jgi:hypothetical protein
MGSQQAVLFLPIHHLRGRQIGETQLPVREASERLGPQEEAGGKAAA